VVERELGKVLVVVGLVTVVAGLALFFGGRIGLGRLPGDISVSRGNFRFYAPLGTCFVLSIIATAVWRLLGSR
jgi:hypothetical protein